MKSAVNVWSRKGDEILRPWAINEGQEILLREAEFALAETITLTSLSRVAGAPGSSVLDPRPPELLELDESFALAEEEYLKAQAEQEAVPSETVVENVDSTETKEVTSVEETEVNDENTFVTNTIQHPRINAVVYVKRKGPAIANLSTTQYQRLVKCVEKVLNCYDILLYYLI